MKILLNILHKIYLACSTWTGAIIMVILLIFFVAQAFVIPSRSMVGTLYEGDLLFVKKFSYGIPIPRIPWIEIAVFPDFRGDGHIFRGDMPKRGDIVVFIPPHKQKTYFVKRAFAVGGDEVIFTRDGMYLHPNEGNEYVKKHYADFKMIKMQDKLFVFEPYSKEHLGINYNEGVSAFAVMSDIYLVSKSLGISPYTYSDGKGISMKAIEEQNKVSFFYKKINEGEFFMVGDNRNNSEDSRFWGSVAYKNIIGQPWFTYFSLNLAGSIEADTINNPKERYNIRWERMFKSISSLEKDIAIKQNIQQR